jgi:hypothetical protein
MTSGSSLVCFLIQAVINAHPFLIKSMLDPIPFHIQAMINSVAFSIQMPVDPIALSIKVPIDSIFKILAQSWTSHSQGQQACNGPHVRFHRCSSELRVIG